MMQPSDGSQPDDSTSGKDFLGAYIDDAIEKLKKQRDPDTFQQTVNGAVPQTLSANPENYQ